MEGCGKIHCVEIGRFLYSFVVRQFVSRSMVLVFVLCLCPCPSITLSRIKNVFRIVNDTHNLYSIVNATLTTKRNGTIVKPITNVWRASVHAETKTA